MRLSRFVTALIIVGLLIAPALYAMPVPSQEPPAPETPRHGSGGEFVLLGDASLAIVVFLAVAMAGSDEEKAAQYGTAGIIVWLIGMSIYEYMYAPQII